MNGFGKCCNEKYRSTVGQKSHK